jgi:acyl carrier protein
MVSTPANVFQGLTTLTSEQRKLFEILFQQQGEELFKLKIPQCGAGDITPLSYPQERVWSVARLMPDSSVDNVPLGFRIQRAFDVTVFTQSIRLLIDRSAVLRATCVTHQAQTGQTVQAEVEPWLNVIDLSDLPESNRLEQAVVQATEIAHLPFDLAKDLLLRATVFCLGPNDFLVLLVAHQFATDGLSFRFLLQELATLYSAIQMGDTSGLAEPVIQYGDFAAWQRQWFTTEMFAAQRDYWQRQLQGAPAQLKLPTYQRSAFPTYTGAYQDIELSAQQSQQLRALCSGQGITVFMAFIALFQTLLNRCTKQEDICVGTLISNRNRPEIEQLLGNFSNNLLLRTTFSPEQTFLDVLAKVKETTIEAYNHQDLPFQDLASTTDNIPKFQVLFILRNSTTAQSFALPGVEVSDVSIDLGLTRMELSLDLTDDGKNPIFGKLEYKADLFTVETIRQLIDNLKVLIDIVVQNPNQAVAKIQLPEVAHTSVEQLPPEGAAISAPVTSTTSSTSQALSARQTELAQQIAILWAEAFNLPHVGLEDNFFELGGHSLMAIRLVEKMQATFGIDIPFSLIFRFPTVSKQAEQVDAVLQRSDEFGVASYALQDEGSAHIIPIQEKGTRPPLFWVNNLPQAQMLGTRWGDERPIYCLNIWGLEGDYVINADVVDLNFMARQFVKSIQEIQPQGPYYLGAHCVNTALAFEIAQQLYRQGETVASLVFVDPLTWGDVRSKLHHWHNFRQLGFDYLFFKLGLRVKTSILKRDSKLFPVLNYLTDKILLRRKVFDDKISADQALIRQNVFEDEISGEINTYIQKYYTAVDSYVPTSYPGKVDVFLAAEYSTLDTSLFGEVCARGVKVQTVREYHTLLFYEESHTNDLAKAMRDCLVKDEAQVHSAQPN